MVSGVWRSGKTLVMTRGAPLPDRCVKCNAAIGPERMRRKLNWHHPAIFLTILAGVVVYVIVAVIVNQRATVELGVCPTHRQRRRISILVSWVAVLGGLVLVVDGAVGDRPPEALAGVVAFFAGLIYAVIAVPIVKPKRIDARYVWFDGCCEDYLAACPELE